MAPWAQNTLGALAARTEQSSPPPLEKGWLGGDKSKEPEATGQAPSAAPALKKRPVVWKSPGSSDASGGEPKPAPLVATDLASLEASLKAQIPRTVEASVKESLQTSLHAELADVKRSLRTAEEHAGIERSAAHNRHGALLKSVEASLRASKDAASSTTSEAQSLLRQAQKEAQAAVVAKLEAESAAKEADKELTKTAAALEAAKADAVARVEAANSDARAAKAQSSAWAMALARDIAMVEMEAASANTKLAEARAEGEAAAEARLRSEIAQSTALGNNYAQEMAALEVATAELAAAKAAVEAERKSVESERDAGRAEVDQGKRLAREQLQAEREQLVADMEAMRLQAGTEAASEALHKQAGELMAQREQIAAERLQMDAQTLALSREAAAARAELAQVEESNRLSHESIAAQYRALEEERAEIGNLLERDRNAYADALRKERESAAAAFASAEASHLESASLLRQELAEAQAVAYALRANSRASTASVDVLVASLAQEVRSLEDEVRRARESEAIALGAQLHSEKVMGAAFEQLSAEAAAAKGIADERIAAVESEAAWQRDNLGRQLDAARSTLEATTSDLIAEQSAVFALRGMLLVADADVAAMRGAAAHYAALGGDEAGQLREALSKAEVRQRDAVEAERRRCDALLNAEVNNFDGMMSRLRESSYAVQAKLSSQLAWLQDALDEKTKQLHAEREGFDVALAKEREATAAAHESSRRVLAEVADRQAARHAAEISEQGAAMEAQLSVEREAFLEQLVDHKEINAHLADARAEARAAKLELAELRARHKEEREEWAAEAAKGRAEMAALVAAPNVPLQLAEERHAAAILRLEELHNQDRARDAKAIASLESQLTGVNESLERERVLHAGERGRMEHHIGELETRVAAERLKDANRTASELEEQLAEAQRGEDLLRNRLRAVTAAAQAEVDRGTTQIGELHDARQRQLRLEHTQLAELHAQSSTALKAMADQREALRTEADAHRRTQEQLLALHETMQRERDAFAQEMAGDRDARAQLPILMAELASTRKLLDEMGRSAAELQAHGKDGGGLSAVPRSPSKKATGMPPALKSPKGPGSLEASVSKWYSGFGGGGST